MPDPIEIRPSDLIERPATWVAGATPTPAKGPGLMDQVKQFIKMAKELKDMQKDLGEMGINLPGLMGGQVPPQEPPPGGQQPAQAPPQEQMKMLAMALRLKYGDCSVNELLDKLRAEYGDKKLSELVKG